MKTWELLHEVDNQRKEIALTFDDGPCPIYTPQIVSLLAEVSGKGTFFMIGEEMEAHSDVVRSVVDAGHEIGNHTFSHPALTNLSVEQCRAELERTDALIHELTGRRPLVFRPPYMAYNEEVGNISLEAGYRAIGAVNGEARDWDNPGVGHIVEKSMEATRSGSILLFHDGWGDRSQTVEAVGVLLRAWSEQGYRFVTVSELLADR
jgi:peptidoglycan/xylan/chitin deacetylase (PgdA/CDA1 family)